MLTKVHPDFTKEPFIETDPDKKISRYKRMCPYCGCVEGPKSTIILDGEYGTVTCKNCHRILAYFEVWDMQTQTRIAKAWCCKHPQVFRKGIGILDNRVLNYGRYCNTVDVEHSKGGCTCTFSEASVDTTPEGFDHVNKYICFKCLTVVTRRAEDMDRNDVTWSQPFLESLTKLNARNIEGMNNMPWFETNTNKKALSQDEAPVQNVDKVDKYPLTLDEYCELPYLVNMQRDLQQFGALVIELNLVVHADSQEELWPKVKLELMNWIQSRMANKEHIPLPAGYEVHNGKVRRTPGTMGAAIPAQYQKYGGLK